MCIFKRYIYDENDGNKQTFYTEAPDYPRQTKIHVYTHQKRCDCSEGLNESIVWEKYMRGRILNLLHLCIYFGILMKFDILWASLQF